MRRIPALSLGASAELSHSAGIRRTPNASRLNLTVWLLVAEAFENPRENSSAIYCGAFVFPALNAVPRPSVLRTKSVWGKKHEQTLFFFVYLLRWELVCADKFPLGLTSVVLDASGRFEVVGSRTAENASDDG